MDRQQKRKAAIFVAMLLFPVVIYYLSPILIVGGAFLGAMTGSFVIFIAFFLLS